MDELKRQQAALAAGGVPAAAASQGVATNGGGERAAKRAKADKPPPGVASALVQIPLDRHPLMVRPTLLCFLLPMSACFSSVVAPSYARSAFSRPFLLPAHPPPQPARPPSPPADPEGALRQVPLRAAAVRGGAGAGRAVHHGRTAARGELRCSEGTSELPGCLTIVASTRWGAYAGLGQAKLCSCQTSLTAPADSQLFCLLLLPGGAATRLRRTLRRPQAGQVPGSRGGGG
jgi:hypothetical protein